MTHVGRIIYSRAAIIPLNMPPVARDEFRLRSTRHHPSTQQRRGLSQSPCLLTFVRVSELYTFSVGSSAEARSGDQAGCCAELEVVMWETLLDDKKLGLGATRLEFQGRMGPICLRRNAGFCLERMEVI